MVPTRLLAIKAVLEIFTKESRPKRAIEEQSSSLDKRDRAFLMEIVYGVVRYRDTLDWVLKDFLKNPAKLGGFTLTNLRIAVYQIFFMRVPDWAVVNESVEIEKSTSSEIAPGKPSLVNAVLRNILRQKDRIVLPIAIGDPVMNIAVNTSHPKWMVRRWVKKFGPEEAARLADANNRIAPLTIRTNTLRISREQLLLNLSEHGILASPTKVSPDGIILEDVRTYEDLSFAHGLFLIQDEASQLVSYLLDPRPGERVLDACAAPGGKATHIAQLMNDSGEVIAVEKDPGRIAHLRENVRSLGINSVKVINADAHDLGAMGTFDRILLDAPCSATGVIRKNPDVKYRHTPEDLAGFRTRQTALLQSVARSLKDNGRLVYAVCSIEPEEGEDAVNDFLMTEGDFRMIDADTVFLRVLMTGGFFRTYPHRHSMDGFFGVAMCRKK